jgi:hypothetical protein
VNLDCKVKYFTVGCLQNGSNRLSDLESIVRTIIVDGKILYFVYQRHLFIFICVKFHL